MFRVSSTFPRISSIRKFDIFFLRILIFLSFIFSISFYIYLFNNASSESVFLFSLVLVVLGFRIFKLWLEWYHYWSPSIPVPPVSKKIFTVDVFTTYCDGEPIEMVLKTLQAIKKINYPHYTFLCDESNNSFLKDFCFKNQIIYVTRTDKKDAKAGNINNALKNSTSDLVLILDPDHIPVPEFLDRLVPYFEDSEIGYVQCIQSYYNQNESIIARASAEQSFHFYGPMMMTMNSYGTVQAIGANCLFRRSALDSIGGHAPGLAEDMHTAMRLQAKGWKSVYVPEVLSKGLTPSTVLAYFKQQLKWSRGVFELLFRVFPLLFSKFTLRQKFHYITSSVFFLSGLFQLLEFIVPIIALFFSISPFKIDVSIFVSSYLILSLLSYVIRIKVQKWLPEDSERGFHFWGGILLMGSWWVFLTGFIYSLFNINVPYIPTPKNDTKQNNWLIFIPNLFIIVISFFAIAFGLSRDYTPYSLILSFILIIQIFPLFIIGFFSQEKLMIKLYSFNECKLVYNSLRYFKNFIFSVFYPFFHRVYPLLFVLLFISYYFFYQGEIFGDKLNELNFDIKKKNKISLDLISLDLRLSENDGNNLCDFLLNVNSNHKVPFIKLFGDTFSSIVETQKLKSIYYGYLDEEFSDLANVFINFHSPIFITLAKTKNMDSISGNDFVSSWKYLFEFFNKKGVSNLTWIFSMDGNYSKFNYPGISYVDAFKIEYKSTFDAKLFRLHKDIANNKPVFYFNIDEGKCFSYVLDNNSSIYSSVKGYHADLKTQNSIENIAAKSGFQPFEIFNDFFHLIEPEFETEIKSTKHIKIFRKDKLGNFNFLVDNKPFVIKGVAYNLSHDWRDGPNYPSREQLSSDFKLISQMGATVVRRYASDIYDYNILNVAKEFNLKVQFGFWFDPTVDYSKDNTRLNQYYNEVESTVKKWKGHPSVLMWSLGNECWGQLKHHFGKPYLIEVRSAYLAMIERMARMIHEIDSVHPVATCIEHEETQLPSELVNLRLYAPSLDAIGINSYYQGQISKLDSVFLANDTTRPYFISEFGPEGYWNDHYNKISKSRINEQSSLEKADWYAYQWRNYIEKNSGRCLGGVAYCWQDRMEGSYTWFGITDHKNRLKPAYWSIKNIWSTISENEKPNFIYPQIASFSMGNYKIFSIKNLNDFGKEIKVEWKILKQEYLYPYSDYKLINNGYSICVVIPKEEEYLRVYLYLYDESNNVITSSLPVYFESISGDPPPLMASSP